MRERLGRREFLSFAPVGVMTAATVDSALAGERAGGRPEAGPGPLTNDTAALVPKTEFEGPKLAFDFPALHVGVAEYPEGPTGCTVLFFPQGASCAVDVRGGSPGTLMPADGALDALCFAGGSLYGLEAATGVAAELFARCGYATKWTDIPLVRGAIIFDFRPRANAVYPDKALGRAALKAARPGTFPLGPRGAGCSATVGKSLGFDRAEAAGQGGAFRQVGRTKVAVFSVVNAIGGIVNRRGQVVRGHLDRTTGKRPSALDGLEPRLLDEQAPQPSLGNTTLTAVVTNRKLSPRLLTQFARQVHSSMARAIQPFHALEDGDVLYAVTTNEVESKAPNATALGLLASELAWDAVLNCFQGEKPKGGE